MRTINMITLALLIIGGLNWGAVGLFDYDAVARVFGDMTPATIIVYVLVGISALWQIIPLVRGEEVFFRPHEARATFE